MPRTGYTNYAPTDDRAAWFERLARALGLDPEQHAHRVKMLDWAMMAAVAGLPPEQEQEEDDGFGTSEGS